MLTFPTMEEWMVNMMEFAEMAKLTAFIREDCQNLIMSGSPLLTF